tara:strand:+ start:800 stop:1174 length:375 start_codon:yes stop_codon:yes gene_type:complete
MKKIIISACLLLGSISASAQYYINVTSSLYSSKSIVIDSRNINEPMVNIIPISSGEPSAHFFEVLDANKVIVNLNDTIEGSARKICSSTKGSAQTCDVYSSIDNQVLISIKEGIGLKVWVSQRK